MEIATALGIGGTASVVGVKWLMDFWRGSSSESVAIKNLTEEVTRLAARVGQLEIEVSKRDDEVVELNDKLDTERKARRAAEDELDKEQRARRALEARVAELERVSGQSA